MSPALRRWLVLGVLAGWIAPALGPLAVGLHLALEHSGPSHHGSSHHGSSHHGPSHHGPADHRPQDPTHDGRAHAAHDARLGGLLRAATHGHHHEVDTHEHRHVLNVSLGTIATPAAKAAALAPTVAPYSAPDDSARAEWTARRGPPSEPLRGHCVLLL